MTSIQTPTGRVDGSSDELYTGENGPRDVETGPGPTTLPRRNLRLDPPPARRKVRGVSQEDVLDLVGGILVGGSITALLFGRLAPFSGLIGEIILLWVLTVGSYCVLVALHNDWPAVKDRVMTAAMWSIGALMLLTLLAVALTILVKGFAALIHVNFYTQDLSRAGPLQGLKVGGAKHAIIGSLWMISIAVVLTVPLGVLCAIYLSETTGPVSRTVRTIVEAMTALPSVIAGLFIFAVWVLDLHEGFSGFAAAMALGVMMLPIIVRASDVVLRLVPGTLKEASAALGAPRWRTMWHVVLPTARSGLTTAVILGMARGIGETSPVLLTAGYTLYTNTNPFAGPMVSLPLAAFKLIGSPEKSQIARGFGFAAFLLILVIVLFAIARFIGGQGPGRQSNRQVRRAQRQSARDMARFAYREQQRQNHPPVSARGDLFTPAGSPSITDFGGGHGATAS